MAKIRTILGGCLALAWVAGAPAVATAQAVLALDASGGLTRGGKSTITVGLSVKAKAVSFHRLYVKLRCRELIDLTQTVTEEKDDKGKKTSSSKSINVKREEVLFEKEIPFAVAGKEFTPGSNQTLTAEVDIPDQLPPTARGKYARFKWEAQAQGDVVGKFFDATSGWQELNVK